MTTIARTMPAWTFRTGARSPRMLRVADALSTVAIGAALVAYALAPSPSGLASVASDPGGISDHHDETLASARAERAQVAERVRYRGGEVLVAAYGGAPYTYASDLHVTKDGRTDMTVHGIDWLGEPFDNPIYYGARVARWLTGSAFGVMTDFTHSKASAPRDQRTTLSGTRDGTPLPPEAAIGDLFHHLEFTHGHNMLTLNLLWRLPLRSAFISPYVGAGLGASLPHTEVQFKGAAQRTYEYQYTGPAAQAVLGIEIRVPHISYFIEYKLTWASYRAPLHNRDGSWLPADLLHQFQRWWSGREPEDGWASTRLVSHQVIAGLGYRTMPAAAAP